MKKTQPVFPFHTRFFRVLMHALESTAATRADGSTLELDDALGVLCGLSLAVQESGRYQFLCGNGASAAFANHMALDWTKNAEVPTHSFSDSALLTAMGNDLGYEHAFSAPLGWYAKPGDLLVTISSSGNSPNIIRTIGKARELGLQVVTISGLRPDNQSRKLGDLNLYVPSETYGIAESAHQVLLHTWLDRFLGIPYELPVS
jgi:D-sedoheptulose 7-phosphate isomerase